MNSEIEINLSIHPHKLILTEEMNNDQEILYRWCLDRVNRAYYNCKECSFSVHNSCADHISLKWHSHEWIYNDRCDGGCFCCRLCGEMYLISSPTVVRLCKTFIHWSGANNLPREIKHVFHRKHSPFLVGADHSWSNLDRNCLYYYCNCCQFTLDMKTALQRPLCLQESDNHKHQFIRFMRSEQNSSQCDACGLKTEKFGTLKGSFLCTICQIIVHDDCTALENTIKIHHHNHPLTHTFFFLLKEGDMPPADKINCRLCHKKVDMDFGGYYCAGCHFATHVICANLNQISTNNPYVHDQDAIIDLSEEIELKENELTVDIKHFSHEHKLFRSDEVEDKCCDGCIRPISLPFYGCVECDFFLHKACIDLPHKIKRAFHEHPLTLIPSLPDNINATFRCFMCSWYCHGFVYSCEYERDCFSLDVRCASIPLSFRHPGHDHKLSFTYTDTNDTRFDSCGARVKYYFKCNECPFGIDYRCATLPSTARYGDHDHPFVLTYHTIDDDFDAYYCDLCEKERDPKHWYYYCAQAECDYAAHPSCALGKYPYLLPGRSYNISRCFFTLQGSNFEHRINLCSECHSLPLIPKIFNDHTLHKHPVILKNGFHDLRDCDICRKFVFGSLLRFYCGKCDFHAHLECILGVVFTRRRMTLDIIRRTCLDLTCLPCMVCDEDCRDVCLKCPVVECSFCVHFDCAVSLSSM